MQTEDRTKFRNKEKLDLARSEVNKQYLYFKYWNLTRTLEIVYECKLLIWNIINFKIFGFKIIYNIKREFNLNVRERAPDLQLAFQYHQVQRSE